MAEVSNNKDILDSRDIIQRIEDLRDLDDERELHEDEELYQLEKLAEQCEGYGDWHHGEALIRDSFFPAYAKDHAEDIGQIRRDPDWPANHIDWDAAAEELKQDYMLVEFDGVDYWMRT